MAWARTVIGIVLSIIGLLLVGLGGLGFNSLFFTEKMVSQSDIPSYGQAVVLPLLVGFLLLVNGSVILGLKRRSSLILHILADLAWIYGLSVLVQQLRVPIMETEPYKLVFYLAFGGILLFVLGFIINDIPKRQPA